MALVEFKDLDGNLIHINPQMVLYIAPNVDRHDNEDYVYITFAPDIFIKVQGPYADVVEALEDF